MMKKFLILAVLVLALTFVEVALTGCCVHPFGECGCLHCPAGEATEYTKDEQICIDHGWGTYFYTYGECCYCP